MSIFDSLIIFILILSISQAACHVDEKDFLRCMPNRRSAGKYPIANLIHGRGSSTYQSLLEFASQNPRWLNSTSERPFLIVVPHKENDVARAIFCCKKFNLQIRVKSGGHDYEGLSFRSKAPFIMIDLTNLDSVYIDLKRETAWIQAGVKLGRLYYEIAKKSSRLAFPAGLFASVGSGGHISGGGLGTLMRKYGLASDNVLDARVMDVNGKILDRNAMGEELFWALRGGGGASFGVIVAWKLKLVPVPEKLTAFAFRRKLEPGNLKLLQKWQRLAHKLPDDLFIRAIIQNVGGYSPADPKIVQVTYNGLFLGPAEELVEQLNKSFPEFELENSDCFRPPVSNSSCTDRPCIKKECYQLSWIQSVLMFGGKQTDQPTEILLNQTKNGNYFNKATSDFLKAPIPKRGWKMICKMFLSEERPMMIIDPFGGKMDEIGEGETPFPHRKGNLFNIQYMSNWAWINEEKVARQHIEWIRSLYKKMTPYVARSPRTAYINYRDLDLGRNDDDFSYEQAAVWGEKYFKGNFERLAIIKGKIDPGNFFRNEQSIPALVRA